MVANKIGLLLWSTDKVHKEMLTDQLSAMEQCPNANPVLAANGGMQYKWFKFKLKEQQIVFKVKIQLKEQVSVADGKSY